MYLELSEKSNIQEIPDSKEMLICEFFLTKSIPIGNVIPKMSEYQGQ